MSLTLHCKYDVITTEYYNHIVIMVVSTPTLLCNSSIVWYALYRLEPKLTGPVSHA